MTKVEQGKMIKIVKEWLPCVIVLVIVILFRTFIATLVRVDGVSMYPTLEGKEIMLLYKLGSVERYDMVVTDKSVDSLIKRVYGLPGETIECKDGVIYINNEAIEDKYGSGETYDFEAVKLKDDEYFVLGDNRMYSRDSRSVGPINKKHLKGTTNFIVFPFKKFGTVEK